MASGFLTQSTGGHISAAYAESFLTMIALCHRFTVSALCRFADATLIYSHAIGTKYPLTCLTWHFRAAAAAKRLNAIFAVPHLFAIGTIRHFTLQGRKEKESRREIREKEEMRDRSEEVKVCEGASPLRKSKYFDRQTRRSHCTLKSCK